MSESQITDLERHKECLEKARVALEKLRDAQNGPPLLRNSDVAFWSDAMQAANESIRHINEVLKCGDSPKQRQCTDVIGYATTTDCCSECGAKLKNAETSRLEYQQRAFDADRLLRACLHNIGAFRTDTNRELYIDVCKFLGIEPN